jgi:hypothetical protein
MEDAMAQEEAPGQLIETFTLSPDAPAKAFFEGKLKVELVGITATDDMKTVRIRIASRALKAEYGDEWQEHTYLEMLRYYVGNPISGSPFKCAEGWLYYEKSDGGGVTLSLRANPHMSGSFAYDSLLLLLENWKKVVVALCLIGLAFFLYYYTPLLWGFISIQHLAHEHAMQTGFPSSPVFLYLVYRLPVLVAFYLLFDFFFSEGWKGVAVAAAIAIGLQLFFNWHNTRQLQTYASIKHFTAIPDSRGRAVQGHVKGMPVALAVGGTFVANPYYAGDYQSGGPTFYMSFLVLEVSLRNPQWDGLVLTREIDGSERWSATTPVEMVPRIRDALAGISRLSRYSILRLEVRGGKLVTMKMFAPDTPAEINLLVDLVADVAQALEGSRP